MADKIVHCTTSSALWRAVASDGTLHASLAAITAASKVPYPGLDAGMHLATLMLKCEDGADGNGSPFFYALNRASVSADTEGMFVSGSGQTVSKEVVTRESNLQLWNVWIRKTVAGDVVILAGEY